jgi:DNA-binding NarL/FixJ family response regulator
VTICVVVADDQRLVRSGFRILIDSAGDMQVVGEADDGQQAIELTRRERPDVVLMDIRMPNVDGLEATRVIFSIPELRDVRVLMLTTFDLDEYVFEALRSGASGFLLKDALPEELLSAIRVVAQGEALLAPRATRTLIAEFTSRPQRAATTPDLLTGLTPRERDVLQLVAEGLTNHEIANHLFLSVATVKTHISRLLTKLGARDRAQLVVIAYQTRFIEPHTHS